MDSALARFALASSSPGREPLRDRERRQLRAIDCARFRAQVSRMEAHRHLGHVHRLGDEGGRASGGPGGAGQSETATITGSLDTTNTATATGGSGGTGGVGANGPTGQRHFPAREAMAVRLAPRPPVRPRPPQSRAKRIRRPRPQPAASAARAAATGSALPMGPGPAARLAAPPPPARPATLSRARNARGSCYLVGR